MIANKKKYPRFFCNSDNGDFNKRDYYYYYVTDYPSNKKRFRKRLIVYFKDGRIHDYAGGYRVKTINKYCQDGLWIEIPPEEAVLMK